MKVFQNNVDELLITLRATVHSRSITARGSLQNLKKKFKRTKHCVEKCSWKIDTLEKMAEQIFNILHSKGS